MQGYTAKRANGEAIYFEDRKRWLWALSVAYPLQPFLGIWILGVDRFGAVAESLATGRESRLCS